MGSKPVREADRQLRAVALVAIPGQVEQRARVGEPYKANCYKLVAAIIPRAPIHVYAMSDSEILTIGHSNHPIVRFIDLLRLHGVTAVADIRSAPYSRFNPQFNKEALERVLREHGIAYVFLGKELGARSSDPNCYDGGQVRYERLAQTTQFHSGLARVTKGAKSHRIALMCAEKEPLECHRTLLVARELARQGVSVSHIHGDGHLERHHTAMSRLPAFVGLPPADLLSSEDDQIAAAHVIQEKRIGYTDDRAANDPLDVRSAYRKRG